MIKIKIVITLFVVLYSWSCMGQYGALDMYAFGQSSGPKGSVTALALQQDGKLIIGGGIGYYNGIAANNIARIHENGFIDTTFKGDIHGSSVINTIVIQPDGKILIGGAILHSKNTIVNHIVRFNADGSVDPSFKPGLGPNSEVNSIVVLNDGKILIGGAFSEYDQLISKRLIRLNSNGTRDNTFSIGQGFDAAVNAIALQEDGKIIAVGDFTSYNYVPENYIVRLNSDGSRDPSFNVGSGANAALSSLCLQADGKIIIGGGFTLFNGNAADKICRLNADGSTDTSTKFTLNNELQNTLDILQIETGNDGKIYVGKKTSAGSSAILLQRLNSDGSTDPTFTAATSYLFQFLLHSDGYIYTSGLKLNYDGSQNLQYNNQTGCGTIFKTLVQKDQKILLLGQFSGCNLFAQETIIRLKENGLTDSTFKSAIFNANAADVNKIMLLQKDEKIVVVGNFKAHSGEAVGKVIRLESNGEIDSTFSFLNDPNFVINNIAIQDDGKMLLVGYFALFDGVPASNIIRINTNGTRDTSFSINTKTDTYPTAVATQADGKIFIAGNFTNFNKIPVNSMARLHADGTFDDTFKSPENPSTSLITHIYPRPKGQMMLVGNFTIFDDHFSTNMVLLNSDGTVDKRFKVAEDSYFYANNFPVEDLIFQSDGKIIACGKLSSHGMKRFNTDGTIDNSFCCGAGGGTEVDFSSTGTSNIKVYSMSIQANGKLIIGGSFVDFKTPDGTKKRKGIARLKTGLSFEPDTFSTVSIYNPNYKGGYLDAYHYGCSEGANSTINEIKIQEDGKILIGGNFRSYNDVSVGNFARLTENGFIDSTFQTWLGANFPVTKLTPLSDGKVLIGGEFTTYRALKALYIARINTDGSKDETFNSGFNTKLKLQGWAIQPDGKILVGTNYTDDYYKQDYSIGYVERLNTDGSLDKTLIYPYGHTYHSPSSIIAQKDGKFIVGAPWDWHYSYNASGIFKRFNNDGSLDVNFNNAIGSGPSHVDGMAGVSALYYKQDGKIIVIGRFDKFNNKATSTYGVCRIDSNGVLDPSFSYSSKTTLAEDTTYSYNILKDETGFIMSSPQKFPNGDKLINFNNLLVRLDKNDKIVRTFNWHFGSNHVVEQMIPLSNGDMVICGKFTEYDKFLSNKMVRVDSSGLVDQKFISKFGSDFSENISSIAVQGDGKILAAGNFTFNGVKANTIIRINLDGSKDNSFTFLQDSKFIFNDVAVQQDGKILVAGDFKLSNGLPNSKILRLNVDGSIDPKFSLHTSADSTINSIGLQSDGKIIVSGGFNIFNGVNSHLVARLNTDGTIDNSFHSETELTASLVSKVFVRPNDEIFLAGYFTTYNGHASKDIIKLNKDGVVDSSFSSQLPSDFNNGIRETVMDLVFQKDGKIIVGGSNYLIRRLNSDGSADESFNGYSLEFRTNGPVYTMVGKENGEVVLGGNFSKFYDGQNVFSRLHVAQIITGQPIEKESVHVVLSVKDVKNLDTQNTVKVYPNPAGSILNIESKASIWYNLMDLKGLVLKSGSEKNLDLSELASGTYFISIKTESETYIKKFVKQ